MLLLGRIYTDPLKYEAYMVCIYLNICCFAVISVRVSNELGAGRPRATMYAVIVVIATSLAIGLLSMAGILALRDYFPVIFTSDKDLQRAVSNIAGLLGVTMVLNSVQPVISGKNMLNGAHALLQI